MSDSSPVPGSPPGTGSSASNPPPSSPPGGSQIPPPLQGDPKAYWRANIRLVGVLMLIWFIVSCVLSILAVDALNEIHVGGFPLGFWFSQQGSIIVFILLILAYAIGMTRIDRAFGVEEGTGPKQPSEDETPPAASSSGEAPRV